MKTRRAKLPPLPALPAKGKESEKNDVFSSSKRSEIMSRVRSTRNKSTELRLIDEFRVVLSWDGDGILNFLVGQILSFPNCVLRFLSTVVFGTDMTVAIRRPKITQITGARRSNEIVCATPRPQNT